MIENYNLLKNTQGSLIIQRRKVGSKLWEVEARHNLVTTYARKVVRDLVYGKWVPESGPEELQVNNIMYLGLGDMGLTLAAAQQQVPAESLDDKVLVNPTVWIPITGPQYPNNSVTAFEDNGRPAIRYEFFLSGNQGNTTSGFFCEIALCIDKDRSPNAYTFTKLNRSPIVKGQSDELLISYELLF